MRLSHTTVTPTWRLQCRPFLDSGFLWLGTVILLQVEAQSWPAVLPHSGRISGPGWGFDEIRRLQRVTSAASSAPTTCNKDPHKIPMKKPYGHIWPWLKSQALSDAPQAVFVAHRRASLRSCDFGTNGRRLYQ